MTRITLKAEGELDAATCTHIRGLIGQQSAIPNLWLLIANAPGLLKAWTDFSWPLRKSRHVAPGLCELMIMRTAQLSRAQYSWAHHWSVAIAAGIGEQQLVALSNWRKSDLFNNSERAALGLADELVQTGRVSDAAFKALRDAFDEPAVTQLVMVVAFYICVARFTSALELDLEPQYVDKPPLS